MSIEHPFYSGCLDLQLPKRLYSQEPVLLRVVLLSLLFKILHSCWRQREEEKKVALPLRFSLSPGGWTEASSTAVLPERERFGMFKSDLNLWFQASAEFLSYITLVR